MSANPHRRKLITLLGASAAAAAIPARAIGAAKAIDARVFAPAVESAVPLDLVLPGRFVCFVGVLELMSVPSTAADRAFAEESLRRARLMLADEVDPYPSKPRASNAGAAP